MVSCPVQVVKLSDLPGNEEFGALRDRYVQLPVRIMIGNGLTWAIVLTILTDPQRTGSKICYRVKKFNVPAHIVRLLGNLPLGTGSGIRGDVLVIDWMAHEAYGIL